MIKSKSLLTDFRFLLIFLVIFVSSETLFFGTNANDFYLKIKSLFIYLLFPISFLLIYKEKKSYALPSTIQVVLLLFAVFLILCSLVNGFTLGYISRFLLILTGFNIAYAIKRDIFWKIFEKIVFFIAYYSVVVFIINLIAPQIIRLFPVIYNTADYSFYNLIFCNIPTNTLDFNRLFGPFREPGVFQMFLMMGLMTHWIQSKPINRARSFIYILAIFLTFSTTGYVAFALLFLIYRFSNSKVRFKEIVFYMVLYLMVLTIYIYTDVLSEEGIVFGKLNDENASTTARFGSILGNLHVFSSSPLFGVGVLAINDLYENFIALKYLIYSPSNTNTILIQFSTFGLFYGLLWSYGFCRFWKNISQYLLPSFLFVILGIILFSGENLTENVLVYIIIGYGFLNSKHATTKV